MTVVMVEPGKPAYLADVDNTLRGMQKAVRGYIETINWLKDPQAIIVANERAKLEGMPGNRRFKGHIIAGTFFICGVTGDGFKSLPPDRCAIYLDMFKYPEDISDKDVQDDMHITFISGE